MQGENLDSLNLYLSEILQFPSPSDRQSRKSWRYLGVQLLGKGYFHLVFLISHSAKHLSPCLVSTSLWDYLYKKICNLALSLKWGMANPFETVPLALYMVWKGSVLSRVSEEKAKSRGYKWGAVLWFFSTLFHRGQKSQRSILPCSKRVTFSDVAADF